MGGNVHRSLRVFVAGLLVVGAAGACHRGAPGEATTRPAGTDVVVYVTNHYELPMEVYAEANGSRQRLGLVNQETTRSFVLPQLLVGNGAVEFTAQPTGYGPIIHTEQLVLHAGHVVDFEITVHLIGSRANIRM